MRLQFLDRVPDEEIGNYRLYSGHFFFNQVLRIPQPRKIVTLLRDPRKRLLSLYYFFRAHRWEHIEYLDSLGLYGPRPAKELDLCRYLRNQDPAVTHQADNSITRHLVGSRYIGPDGSLLLNEYEAFEVAVANLNRMDAFGVVEHYDLFRESFARAIGWSLPPKLPFDNTFQDITTQGGIFEPVDRQSTFDDETEAEIRRCTAIDQRIFDWTVHTVLSQAEAYRSRQTEDTTATAELAPISR